MIDAITNEGNTILQFFNLQDTDVKSLSASTVNGEMVADVELPDTKPPCKHCGCTHIRLKETNVKLIRHSNIAGRPCLIRYHAHRYKCLCCGRTFYEDNPFVFKAQKISAGTVINILDDLKNPAETFSNVADRYHISQTSVANIFDQHVDMKRLPLPPYMCIDESYSFKSENSNYVCMFVDFETGAPIDILPSRRKEDLFDYFRKIPLEERRNVRIVGIDMWATYRSVVKELFPRAIISLDHYHVKQDLNRKADKVRIRVMKRYSTDTWQYYLLKHFNWLIFKHLDATDKEGNLLFDQNRPGKYNIKFKKELNYYDLLQLIRSIDPELTEAIDLKNKCNDFYTDNTYDTAEKALKALIKEFRAASSQDMVDFGNTMAAWRQEIINSFIVISNEYSIRSEDGHVVSRKIKVNSSIIERQNSTVKVIKKVTMSMGNWERFRNRVLYSLRKDATYNLNPVDTPKARKNYKLKDSGKNK